MILLDTNVLSYAVGEDHPLRERCRRILAHGRSDATELATTVEVLQEFAHVRSRRRSRDRTISMARLFAGSLAIVTASEDDVDHGLELFVKHQRLDAFDAVLAAVALRHDAPLVSADRAFAGVPGLRHIDPATPDLDALLVGNS